MRKFIIFLFIAPMLALGQYEKMPLYQGEIPNSIAVENKEKIEKDGFMRISNITIPELWYFPAKQIKGRSNTCVLVIPGGGYGVVAAGHEGIDVAKVLNSWGVSAFVLKYRLPNDKAQPNKSIAPLQDVQQALGYIRKNASKYQVSASKLGVLGFSAGGHLASTAGTHWQQPLVIGATAKEVRPDFMVLGYPVISFKSFGHKGSTENLIGKTPTEEQLLYYCNDLQVDAETPPTFLFHSADDMAVPVKNSLVFYEALVDNKVPAEMHLYPNGGHGYGMNNKTTTDRWMDRLKNWMIGMKLL